VFDGRRKNLVARWVGIEDGRVKAAWDSVGNGTVICSDDYRHCNRANGCTMNAFSRCEGVSGNHRNTREADDNGCSKRNNGST
jgi:hypothetical protein